MKLFFILSVLILIVLGCNTLQTVTDGGSMNKENYNSIYINGKFFNVKKWKQPGMFTMLKTMGRFLFSGNNRTPKELLPVQKVDLSKFNDSSKNNVNVTWLGHSTTLININGYKIITDPVLEMSASIFGPTRYNCSIPVETDSLKQIDVVLISHNHYDHLNKYSIKLLNEETKLFIVPLKVGELLMDWGVDKEKIIELDWWEEYSYDENLTLTATPSQHFSGRGLFDRDKTLWASYVVRTPNNRIFFSGDGGYSESFKEIGNEYGPFDLTIMECGAYDKTWHHIHSFPEETIQAHLDLKGKILQPIHWGTFNLALHAWYEPMYRAVAAAEKNNVQLALPIVGETVELGKYIPQDYWWEEYVDNKLELNLAKSGIK